jgi:hypothetical protein
VKCRLHKISVPVLVFLASVSMAGCEEFNRFSVHLIEGTYEVPTPYITPVAGGSNYLTVTPFPEGTPILDKERCFTMEGDDYLIKSQVTYHLFKLLRGTTGEAKRKDIPAIVDEMRSLHSEIQALEPPEDCEILIEYGYHIEAEIDQTIRALIAFRNVEPDEVMLDYFNEALFHQKVVQELFDRMD